MNEENTNKQENKTEPDKQNEAPLKEKEEGGDKTQIVENVTECNQIRDFSESILDWIEELKLLGNKETVIKKQQFLLFYGKTLGSVKESCKAVNINKITYWRWGQKDKEFVNGLEFAKRSKLEDVEQQLNALILDKDGPSIRFWLERNHPDYKQKVETHITGNQTISPDELVTIFLKQKLQINLQLNGDKQITNEQRTEDGIHGGVLQDKGQEGTISSIQVQQSPKLLLEKKDEKKLDSETKTKGTEQGHRRGPAPRLHTEMHKLGDNLS